MDHDTSTRNLDTNIARQTTNLPSVHLDLSSRRRPVVADEQGYPRATPVHLARLARPRRSRRGALVASARGTCVVQQPKTTSCEVGQPKATSCEPLFPSHSTMVGLWASGTNDLLSSHRILTHTTPHHISLIRPNNFDWTAPTAQLFTKLNELRARGWR